MYPFLFSLNRSAPADGNGEAAPPADTLATRPAPALAELPRPSGPLHMALARTLRALWTREPVLAAVGALGLTLAALLALAAALRGNVVPPEGNLLETASFDGAVGIFVLTLAAFAPLAAFTPRGRRRWVAVLVAVVLSSYAIETVQAMRGLDPRFSAVAGPVDQTIGGLFFLIAQGILLAFAVLAWKFFRPTTAHLPHAIRISVRYGATAALLAFMVGNVMSAAGGRAFGEAGNLLPLHAAGFHGMQAVPLVALFLVWARVPENVATRWTHLAGLAWLAACGALAAQSFSGLPILAPSPWMTAAVAAFGLWAATVLFAVPRARAALSIQPA